MLKRSVLFFALSLLCSPAIAGQAVPTSSNSVQQGTVYHVTVEDAWNAALKAIRENDLTVASASKDALQITTGYGRPAEEPVAGGFMGVNLIRDMYVVYLKSKGQRETEVVVQVLIERSHVAGGLADAVAYPFVNVTTEPKYAKFVATLHDWFSKKVGAEMKPFEVVATAQ